MNHRIQSLSIQGFRVFRDITVELGPLQVIVGANGSGKSSLFEFLRFLRDAVNQDIPKEIVKGWVGQRVFHIGLPERLSWSIEVNTDSQVPIQYIGEVIGPVGQPRVVSERVQSSKPISPNGTANLLDEPYIFLDTDGREGVA